MYKTLKKTKEWLEAEIEKRTAKERLSLYEAEVMYFTICLDCVNSKLNEMCCGDDDF